MASVNLTKKISVAGKGLRFCPVVYGRNGRVRPDYVTVDGHEEHHPEGTYYIEWRDDGRRGRKAVGQDAAEAENARRRQESVLERANGVQVVEPEGKDDSRLLRNAIAKYLADTKDHKKNATYDAYEASLNYFLECCKAATFEGIQSRPYPCVPEISARPGFERPICLQ